MPYWRFKVKPFIFHLVVFGIALQTSALPTVRQLLLFKIAICLLRVGLSLYLNFLIESTLRLNQIRHASYASLVFGILITE